MANAMYQCMLSCNKKDAEQSTSKQSYISKLFSATSAEIIKIKVAVIPAASAIKNTIALASLAHVKLHSS